MSLNNIHAFGTVFDLRVQKNVRGNLKIRINRNGKSYHALAGPYTETPEINLTGKGIDIVICMDVSASMNYEDFKPNRLEVSKALAIDFIRKRVGDNIGVVVLADRLLPCAR
jgi:hypothetical protein